MIFDFEMTKVIVDIRIDSNTHDTFTRSPSQRWKAPELDISNCSVNAKADVWSFGLVMWEVFALQIPWPNIERDAMLQLCVRDGLRPTRPKTDWVTDEVWTLMQECWKDPDERPSMEDVENRLRGAEQSRKDCLALQPGDGN